MKSRPVTLTRRQMLVAVGLSGIAATGYGMVVEPMMRFRVQRYAPKPKNWPSTLRLRIAALADPHLNEPFTSASRIEEIVGITNALKPDLVVLLGDYASGHRFVTRRYDHATVASLFAQLRSPLGTYAIMGNHDWWDDAYAQSAKKGPLRIAGAFERAGIACLENDALRLNKDGQAFWLAGLGDQHAFYSSRHGLHGVDDLPATLAKLKDDAPAILLAHEPDVFPAVPDRISLTLSGHTHGGQITLAGFAPMVPSRFGRRYRYGHIIERDNHLIVSGGIGCTGLPIRVGVPPEVVLIDL